MTDSLTTIVEKTEEEEPPSRVSLDNLNIFLNSLTKNYPDLNRIQAYDNGDYIYICIGDFKDKNLTSKIPYVAFRIYNDGNIADNNKLSMMHGCGELHIEITDFLKQQGYSKFRNPFVNYIEKRFNQRLADKKTL